MRRKYIDAVDLIALGEGELIALASTFGNVDAHGDRVVPGAFSVSVAKIKAGTTVPLVWGHDVHGSPQNFVGEVDDADETDEGLQVHGRFDLEDPVARKAYRLVKSGAIDKLSIGYRIREERRARDGANELLDIDLKEVSLVLTPANDRARVLAVKTATATRMPTDAELRRRWAEIEASLPRRRSAAELRKECDRRRLDTLMDGVRRHDPEPARPSQRELRKQWDQLQMERALDGADTAAISAAREPVPAVTTDAELRRRSTELGFPPPPRRQADYDATRAEARDQMLALLSDEQVGDR